MKRLGIYGGTFAPIHYGHIRAARAFYDELSLDELLIMPAAIPPHKEISFENEPALRLEMARAAFEDESRNITVSDHEISKGGKSYTYLTLEHFCNEGIQLFFLVGTDMLLSLDRWKNPDKIFSLCTICHVRRSDTDANAEALISEAKNRYKYNYKADIIDVTIEPFEVSSTEIRNAVREGMDISQYVPRSVEKIILEARLYRSSPLYKTIRERVKRKRWAHIFSTEDEAMRLSDIFSLSEQDKQRLRSAAILHDLTKYYTKDEHISYLESIGVEIDDDTLKSEKTLHQLSGAYLSKQLHPDIVDDAVFNAIRYHTTGKADMSLTQKLMYLSDYIEPTRTFPDCVKLRKMFYDRIGGKDKMRVLDEIMLESFDMTVSDLTENSLPIHRDTAKGREFIIKQLKG